MAASLAAILLGRERTSQRAMGWGLVATVAFAISFVGYAVGVVAVSGGVIWIPGDAAVVGMFAAAVVGYARGGILIGWLVAYASLLGYSAQRSIFGYSNATVGEMLGYFLDPEGLLVLGLEGLALGVVAVAVGSACRVGVDSYRQRSTVE